MTTGYLLDTNILSHLMRAPDGKAARRLARIGDDQVCTSIIVASELRFGAAKSGSSKIHDHVESLLAHIDVLPLEIPADHYYAEIRASLERHGTPIGPNDMLIAAHALSLGLTLVTDNTAEFKRVSGLKLENWL